MNGTLQNVALLRVGDTIGTRPSDRLLRSVSKMGVVQPVLLAEWANEDGEIELRVVDGNRRIAAARAARMTHVPAVVLTDLSPEQVAQCTLVTNGFRTANYLAEFWAISSLERSAFTKADVLGISGMASSGVDLRSQLRHLNRDLLVALRNGQIAQTEAIAVAKMRPGDQQVAADHFRRTQRLSRSDLKALFPSGMEEPSHEQGEDDALTLERRLAALADLAREQHLTRDDFLALAAAAWDRGEDSEMS